MGQAALALPETYSANDNAGGPTSRDPDLWHTIITGLDKISISFGLFARRKKLSGMEARVFCDMTILAFERLDREREAYQVMRRRLTKQDTLERRAKKAGAL